MFFGNIVIYFMYLFFVEEALMYLFFSIEEYFKHFLCLVFTKIQVLVYMLVIIWHWSTEFFINSKNKFLFILKCFYSIYYLYRKQWNQKTHYMKDVSHHFIVITCKIKVLIFLCSITSQLERIKISIEE